MPGRGWRAAHSAVARRCAARLLAVSLLLAVLGGARAVGCEEFCAAPCKSLNGNIHDECGDCPDEPRYSCRPGAPGFLEQTAETLLAGKRGGTAEGADEAAALAASVQRQVPPQHYLTVPTALLSSAEKASDSGLAGYLVGDVDGRLARVRVWCVGGASAADATPTAKATDVCVAAGDEVSCDQANSSDEAGRGRDVVVERLDDGATWSTAEDAAPLGEPLRRHAAALCGRTAAEAFDSCGAAGTHMYDQAKWKGPAKVETDAACARARHERAYGGVGLPGGGSADAPGHLKAFGMQGQPRRTVETHEGCADAALRRAIARNTPLVMRGCLAERAPRALGWTREYLTATAGTQKSHFCPDELGAYLARGMPYYRNCGGLPAALLADVGLPEALRDARHRLDNAVLWTGNVSYHGKSSPLHFDPNENVMHMVDGQKHLLLLDPVDSPLLYADFANASFGNSPVSPLAVDLATYPLAATAPVWPVRLRAGDALFIPAGWWHIVTTLRGRSVSLTLQFMYPYAHRRPRPTPFFSQMLAEQKLAMRYDPLPAHTPAAASEPPLTLADTTFLASSDPPPSPSPRGPPAEAGTEAGS